MATKKFMYGIGKVSFNGKTVGYIEKDSWEWGGEKGESVDVNAEQVPNAPVLVLQQSNGTLKPTFNMIQLDYETLQQFLGGTLVGSEGAYTGWKAPSNIIEIAGPWSIDLVSGQTVTIPNGKLNANLGGKLSLSEVSKIECELAVMMPDDGSAPYEVNDTVSSTSSTDGQGE